MLDNVSKARLTRCEALAQIIAYPCGLTYASDRSSMSSVQLEAKSLRRETYRPAQIDAPFLNLLCRSFQPVKIINMDEVLPLRLRDF